MKKGLFIILGFVFLMACEHDAPVLPEEEVAASGLDYQVDTLSVLEGNESASIEPIIVSNSDATFSIVVTPFNSSIGIDDNGMISIESTSGVGIYNITVIVNNEGGSTSFQDAIIVEVIEEEKTGIATLVYAEDVLSVSEGEAISSDIPTYEQSPVVSFSLMVSPMNNEIEISDQGIVSVSSSSEPGTYSVTVVATNENGVSTFSNILEVNVNAPIVTFNLNVLPLIEQKCAPCHTSGSQPKWTDYITTRALITSLIDRVEREPNTSGFMPAGRTALTTEEVDILKNWQSDGLIE